MSRRLSPFLSCCCCGLALAAPAAAQTLTGTVAFEASGAPARSAEVVVLETDQVTHTESDGRFEIELAERLDEYTVHVELAFHTAQNTVAVEPDQSMIELQVPILLRLGRLHERVTVSASASAEAPLEAFGSLHALSGVELQNVPARNLAELLEGTPGIAIRSYGPGAARPIVRGFDGDRVLIMEDGVGTGDLGSNSADHGVPVDPLQAERVEVVRGPATLLYGSNAIGGAVNVISMASHLSNGPPPGFRGHANVDYSTADEGRRGGARFQAAGSGWFAWGGGNSNRTGDYESPTGVVPNSETSMDQGEAGLGVFGDRAWFSGSVRIDDYSYGVPYAGEFHGSHDHHGHGEEMGHDDHGRDERMEEEGHEEELQIDVTMNRRQLRSDFGVRELGAVFDEAELTVRYSDYDQDEGELFAGATEEVLATHFDNRSLVLRGELKKPAGRWTSRVGLWSHFREYQASGEESLAPKTRQNAFAAFAYNEFETNDRLSFLIGARLGRNAYDPEARVESDGHGREEAVEEGHEGHDHGHDHGHEEEEAHEEEREAPAPIDRDFIAVSGSAGARLSLTDDTALVGTASLSTRAPSIEELYNFGLHGGTRSFDIGNPSLDPERSLGLELGLRHSSDMFSGSASFFRYDIADFIFGVDTGERVEGLSVLRFLQSDAVYQGYEVEGHADLGPAELVANASYVDATLTQTDESAPRIPPLQGQLRLDVPFGELRLSPRLRWASRMDRLYRNEEATDGYAVFDFTASYVIVTGSAVSNISLRAYNVTDAEYRFHTSLIKDLAPQMGRGFRISYSIQFF